MRLDGAPLPPKEHATGMWPAGGGRRLANSGGGGWRFGPDDSGDVSNIMWTRIGGVVHTYWSPPSHMNLQVGQRCISSVRSKKKKYDPNISVYYLTHESLNHRVISSLGAAASRC
mgnify:CR=1 FL=1